MNKQSDVIVRLDPRIRLVSAALSVTNFPEKAQERKRYYAHAHARGTTKYLKDRGMHSHPAVQSTQTLLDQNAPIEAMYTLIALLNWPGLPGKNLPRWVPEAWNEQLWDFYVKSELESFWKQEADVWEKAEIQAKAVFSNVKFKDFLNPFVGEIAEDLVFVPNICYPADEEVGIRVRDEIIAITPPPQAWGDSPPLPYNEETMLTHSYRAALTQYGRLLMPMILPKRLRKICPFPTSSRRSIQAGKTSLWPCSSRLPWRCIWKIMWMSARPKPIS
jgi:hypothetical protein